MCPQAVEQRADDEAGGVVPRDGAGRDLPHGCTEQAAEGRLHPRHRGVIADDALAARLASLVPDAETVGQTRTTRVVVVGLVSVASIAGFKRHLSRVPGVESVGVSSGPDGEFVFAVVCGLDLDLHDAIATLPGFGARVTGETDGDLHVTARDPENEG